MLGKAGANEADEGSDMKAEVNPYSPGEGDSDIS